MHARTATATMALPLHRFGAHTLACIDMPEGVQLQVATSTI